MPNQDLGARIPQRPRSNSSIEELLLHIYEGGFYRWEKNTAFESLRWLILKPLVRIASLFARVKKGHVMLSLEPWLKRSKNSAGELKLKQKLNAKKYK